MKRVSLRTQLLIGVLAPLFVLGATLHHIQRRTLAVRVYEAVQNRARLAAHAFRAACQNEWPAADPEVLTRLARGLVSTRGDIAYAFVVGPHGQVLAHSFADGFPADLLPMARGAGDRVLHLDTGTGYVCHASEPIAGAFLGAAHVGLSEDADLREMRAALLRGGLVFAAFGALLCGSVGLTLTLLVGKMRQLARSVAALPPIPPAHDPPLVEDGPAETAELAAAFNRLRSTLRDTHRVTVEAERFATAGRLAAGLIHEINNPLAGALSCVRALLAGRVPEGRAAQYLAMTEESLDRVVGVVQRVANFAAGPPGGGDHPVDLAAVARDSVAAVASLAERSHVSLEMDLPTVLPRFPGSAPLLEQALVNVLTNAIEASRPGTTVRLDVRFAPDRGLVLQVSDRGHGMPRSLAERVGEPFFTSKGSGGGLGLGLFLVRGALRHHGGSVELETAQGLGTVVRLVFPLAKTPITEEDSR